MNTALNVSHGPSRRRCFRLAVLFLIASTFACRPAPEVTAPPPPEVTVATPIQKDVTVYHEFVGTTQAYQSVNIRARVQGYLDSMHYEPSSFVRSGQLFFTIEQEPFQAQRDRAAAGLEAAEAGLARAESDLERLEQAVRTNAVSQQEVTRARAERDQASAAVLQAQAELTNAEIQLEYTTIESPIAGMVSRNYVDLGNLVGAGEATLLTTVRQIDPIYAYFEVSERFVAQALEQRGGHKNPEEVDEQLDRVQNELFILGADLSVLEEDKDEEKKAAAAIGKEEVDALERLIDRATGELGPLENFILPGGSMGAALIHVARTICRRAERRAVALAEKEAVGEWIVKYLNRLSDALFVLARLENRNRGIKDRLWAADM